MSTIVPGSTAELAQVLRDAAGMAVQVQGAGTKAHWGGAATHVDLLLQTWRLAGVRAYRPDDLVVTVSAGTRLRDLQAVLALDGQRLALEVGSPAATVGGVLATGEAGPSRLRYGAARDLLLGVEFVRADGTVARSGGSVVKNVAGYDLGRLLCGSYGTLGVITTATFRLHPLPAAQAWVTRPVESAADLVEAIADIVAAPIAPTALELECRDESGVLTLLIEGSRDGVTARAEAAAKLLGGTVELECPQWWGEYPFQPGEVGLKISVGLAKVASVLTALARSSDATAQVRGSAGAGVLYAGLPATIAAAELDAAISAVRGAIGSGTGGRPAGSCVVLTAPEGLRPAVDLWGPVPGLALMRRVKNQFDPHGRFAAGRFVGGI